jgi:two-component system chemotaxis response regulator CheY
LLEGSAAMEQAVTTLIVDDSGDSRQWLRHKLEGIGCVIVGEAESAAEGLARFEALRPRLVTLDIMMPEIDGMTALELLRRIGREDHEAAVLVVSVRPLADSHDFMKLGAIGYLEKPFIDFAEAAKLLRAYFPELGARDPVVQKGGGLFARLAHKA